MSQLRRSAAIVALLLAIGTSLGIAPSAADEGFYRQTNLISDVPGAALVTDSDLVNAWGVSFGPTTPIWISDNGTGLATLYSITYDAMDNVHVAKAGLVVTVPPAGAGNPTGQVFNGDSSLFNGDRFIFASEDGTISGWRFALGTLAEAPVPASDGAVYKGIALSGDHLYAANFRAGTVDVFDSTFTKIGAFAAPDAPAGFAPFNIANVGGRLLVTFAVQDADKHDDVAGPGNGFIDVFDPITMTFARFISGSAAGGKLRLLNSPWGLALAPAGFGEASGRLLVGNFGNGRILAFDALTGKFRGQLEDRKGDAIRVEGLWALTFGNGTNAGKTNILYFTAGPDEESHGLFGSIEAVGRGHEGGKGEDD